MDIEPMTKAVKSPCKSHRPSIAVVEDDDKDFFLLERLLAESDREFGDVSRYSDLDAFLADDVPSPDVVLLDRSMPDSTLTEARIREIHARHNRCGVILHTGFITPSLRATAAHEGALAVVEKGSLSSKAISALVEAAAIVAPEISGPG